MKPKQILLLLVTATLLLCTAYNESKPIGQTSEIH